MTTAVKTLLVLAVAGFSLWSLRAQTVATTYGPQYTATGELQFPQDYRDWTYLTTGFDMSYSPDAQMGDHHMFDNVFVGTESYRSFVRTGTWPDKTVFVLEQRTAQSKGSINKQGSFQTSVMGFDVHVRDDARFKGGWAFFNFSDERKPSAMIPTTVACYSCHSAHAAVGTTFVQFYPTLLPIAREKGTLSQGYLDDEKAGAAADAPAR